MPLFDIKKAVKKCEEDGNKFNALFASGAASETRLSIAARELERSQMALRLMQD